MTIFAPSKSMCVLCLVEYSLPTVQFNEGICDILYRNIIYYLME